MSYEQEISCEASDVVRAGLKPLSSITNFVGGEVLNHNLPPHTATTWGTDDTEILREVLDEHGCRHWLLAAPSQPEGNEGP